MTMIEGTGKTRPSRISIPRNHYLIVMLFSAFLIRLLMAWTPVETLIQKTLSDDAFYYFVIARNVAQGKGPTVDGLTMTNGFHPLWTLLLIPLYAILPGRDNLVVHLGLTVSAVFDVLTAWLAYAIVHSLFKDTKAALAACFFYAFNPRVIMEAVNGLETALSVFFLTLAFYWYSKRLAVVHRPLAKDAFILGGLAGLMVLARTDTVIMAALMGLDMLLQKRRVGLARLLAFGLGLTLVLAPWLLWNQLNFGTVVQSSGVAVPYMAHRHFAHLFRDRELFLMLWKYLIAGVLQISFLLAWHYSGVAWTVILVSLISLRLTRSRPPGDDSKENLALPRHLALPIAAAIIVVLVHTLYRWYPRNWYYVPLAFSASLLAGPVFAKVSQTITQASTRGTLFNSLILGGSALLFLLQGAKEWNEGFYPWQVEMYRASSWLRQHVPPQTAIGSFNAGLYAYYSEHTVVNLDGVTNWEAFEALRQHRLLAYIDERGISYIVDFDEYVNGIYRPFYGEGYPERLDLVAALSAPRPDFGAIVLYEVRP
jgi:hypothetical protein